MEQSKRYTKKTTVLQTSSKRTHFSVRFSYHYPSWVQTLIVTDLVFLLRNYCLYTFYENYHHFAFTFLSHTIECLNVTNFIPTACGQSIFFGRIWHWTQFSFPRSTGVFQRKLFVYILPCSPILVSTGFQT